MKKVNINEKEVLVNGVKLVEGKTKMRICHVPQLGYKINYYVPVVTLGEAKKVYEILTYYDLFQRNNNIKPDFNNLCYLEVFNKEEDTWEEVSSIEEEGSYFEDFNEYFEESRNMKKFSRELRKQI
jgi:hypothetical protein